MKDQQKQLNQIISVSINTILCSNLQLYTYHFIVIEATLVDNNAAEDVIFPGTNSSISDLVSITIPAEFIQCRSEATGTYTNVIFMPSTLNNLFMCRC